MAATLKMKGLIGYAVRVHRKIRDAGVEAGLVVMEGMSHADYFLLPDAPESKSIYKDLSTFLKMHFIGHH
jgi:epsilon-lactone hydrolase